MRKVSSQKSGGEDPDNASGETDARRDRDYTGEAADRMLEAYDSTDTYSDSERSRLYQKLVLFLRWRWQPIRLDNHPLRRELITALMMGQSLQEVSIRFKIPIKRLQKLRNRIYLREVPDYNRALEALAFMGMEPRDIAENLPANKIQPGVDVGNQLKTMVDYLWDYIEKTKGSDKMLPAIREATKLYTEMMKIMEKRLKHGDYNPWEHPEVTAYQDGLIEILRNHPDALEDVIEYTRRYSSRTEESRST